IRIPVIFAQRSGGHPELESGFKILQNLAPVALVTRAASVTLINNDEIEKVSWVLTVQSRTPFVFGEGLINRKIHLPAFYRLSFDLVPRVAEGSEYLVLRV